MGIDRRRHGSWCEQGYIPCSHKQQRARIRLKPCPLSNTILFYRTSVLFPLDGSGSAVSSFQLRPVFGAVSSRVPPDDTLSRFVGFGDKSWDNSKNYFRTQGFEFLFLSQRARLDAFGGSIAPKTPVLKLKCLFACKPPTAIGSESTQVAFKQFAKLQVAGLHCQ